MKFTTLLKPSMSMLEALSVSVTGIIVVMIILALLAVMVVILSKAIRTVENKARNKTKSTEKVVETKLPEKKAPNVSPLPETQSVGSLDLYKTDEKTAAVIMAIVSEESGIPLNRLQFNSIKLIEE